VALLVVDSEHGVTQGDAQIAAMPKRSGRSVIIVMNKWDLAAEAARQASARDCRTTKVKRDAAPMRSTNLTDVDKSKLLFRL